MQYLVIIEQGPTSFGAYVPDLSGCIAVGESREEAAILIQEAIELHIEDLKLQGHQVPAPNSSSELVSVDAFQERQAKLLICIGAIDVAASIGAAPMHWSFSSANGGAAA